MSELRQLTPLPPLLRELDLFDNAIETLDAQLFKDLASLQYVPFVCVCVGGGVLRPCLFPYTLSFTLTHVYTHTHSHAQVHRVLKDLAAEVHTLCVSLGGRESALPSTPTPNICRYLHMYLFLSFNI